MTICMLNTCGPLFPLAVGRLRASVLVSPLFTLSGSPLILLRNSALLTVSLSPFVDRRLLLPALKNLVLSLVTDVPRYPIVTNGVVVCGSVRRTLRVKCRPLALGLFRSRTPRLAWVMWSVPRRSVKNLSALLITSHRSQWSSQLAVRVTAAPKLLTDTESIKVSLILSFIPTGTMAATLLKASLRAT